MNDFYTEQLVKKRTDAKDILLKGLLLVATVVSVFVVFIFPLGIILPVGMIVLDVILFGRLNVEYEYLFVNGDLDIDKIMNRARRKRIFSVQVNNVEMLAPVNHPQLAPFKNVRSLNYSSGDPQARLYALVVLAEGQKKKIIFEPNDTIIDGFSLLAPRKVFK